MCIAETHCASWIYSSNTNIWRRTPGVVFIVSADLFQSVWDIQRVTQNGLPITTWWSAIYIWKNQQGLHVHVRLEGSTEWSARPWWTPMPERTEQAVCCPCFDNSPNAQQMQKNCDCSKQLSFHQLCGYVDRNDLVWQKCNLLVGPGGEKCYSSKGSMSGIRTKLNLCSSWSLIVFCPSGKKVPKFNSGRISKMN